MKYILLCFLIISTILSSCNNNNSGNTSSVTLNGSWRMVAVTDNSTGQTDTKPFSITRDVDVTFTAASITEGNFSGNTPTNEFINNKYSTGTNQSLSVPALNITKVMETTWGKAFVDNIVTSQSYRIQDNIKLEIKTALKTLSFQKF